MSASELTDAVERLIAEWRHGSRRAMAQEIIVLVAQHTWAAKRVERPE